MAACTIDVSHPFFAATLESIQRDPELKEAFEIFKTKVEENHLSCGRVVQPFGQGKFLELHGKIWKYDWGKSSASGRKSWRFVVVVPNPDIQPYRLIAGAVYAKSNADQLPLKMLSQIFASVIVPLKVSEHENEKEFRRVSDGDGIHIRSLCSLCYDSVLVSNDHDALAEAESNHICSTEEN